MKQHYFYLAVILIISSCFGSCSKNDTDNPPNPGESNTELLAKKFNTAPIIDGVVDDMWSNSKRLTDTTKVPTLGPRCTYLNKDGEGTEEKLGLFAPYAGEKYNFTMRAGYTDTDIYFLLEWIDAEDSKNRQSWYFDEIENLWKREHKYANNEDDKFYEDKFALLFPIGEVTDFSTNTCNSTCHSNLVVTHNRDKHTRHYLSTLGEKVDMWHWKRVEGSYIGQIDDQMIVYAEENESGTDGKRDDSTGEAGYEENIQELLIGDISISVPRYVIPDKTDYYWIIGDDVTNGTAKRITGVDQNGVLMYNGGIIDPTTGGFEQGTGNKRIPSIITKAYTLGRGDIRIGAVHTGNKWICEFTRKLNTNDADDIIFDITNEVPFGLAIFNNAAIAHGIKSDLILKFEQ